MSATHCARCGKNIPGHTTVRLLTQDGGEEDACCPACGLLRMQTWGSQVRMAQVTDFFTGAALNAKNAWYVLGGAGVSCCAPPLNAFGSRSVAESFAAGMGGTVLDLGAAIKGLQGQSDAPRPGLRAAGALMLLVVLSGGLGALQMGQGLAAAFAAPPQSSVIWQGLADIVTWSNGVAMLLMMPWSLAWVGLVLAVWLIMRWPEIKDGYRRRRLLGALGAYAFLGVAGPWLMAGKWPLQTAPGAGGSVWSLFLAASLGLFIILALLFGRRSMCGVICPSAIFYGVAGERFIPFNLSGWGQRIMGGLGWVIAAGVVLAAVFSALTALGLGDWHLFGLDPSAYAYGLVWMLMMDLAWPLMPWIGTRTSCRFLCPVGTVLGAVSRLGFFRLESQRPGECRDCSHKTCDRVCEVSCRPGAALAATGTAREGRCTGCGNCVAACPSGNLAMRDVRDLLRLPGVEGAARPPATPGGCCGRD